MRKLVEWYKKQSDTTKALIWLGVVALIGIILRWDYIVESVTRGFEFYSTGDK